MQVTGYAASEGGVLLVNTIHSHPRGAMVNYLCTNRHMPLMPRDSDGDEAIRASFIWFQKHADPTLKLRRVTITCDRACWVDPETVNLLEGV